MNGPVIEIRNLHTRYGKRWVHQGIDLSVEKGDVLALVGGSGSGKTTLLRQMIGLLKPMQGSVSVFGEPLFGGGPWRERALRRRFGVLFQHGALFSALNVFDNIAFPLREIKLFSESEIGDMVRFKLDQVELLPEHGQLMPAELSGGMVKRVALARALALVPELLLLDEPTAGLDPDRSESFVQLIRQLDRELGLTVVLVTHDIATVSALATKVAVLADGRILALETLDQIMRSENPIIRNFFQSDGTIARKGP